MPTVIPTLRVILIMAVALLAAGCATAPRFDTAGIDTALTPAGVAAHPQAGKGRQVLWGGVIIAATNLRDSTELQILAYPLNHAQRPKVGVPPLGRFIAVRQGYLETVDFAPGRQVTVVGPVRGLRNGRVGQMAYVFPVMAAHGLYLWPQDETATEPQIHFGIGVILHN